MLARSLVPARLPVVSCHCEAYFSFIDTDFPLAAIPSERTGVLTELQHVGPTGRRIVVPRHEVPLNLLLTRQDSRQTAATCTPTELGRVRADVAWSSKREQLLAAAAAGVHVALFAWNLAFWGFEGTAPDRYHPDNPRVKTGAVPGRYGNVQGARKLWYYYLQQWEGGGRAGA